MVKIADLYLLSIVSRRMSDVSFLIGQLEKGLIVPKIDFGFLDEDDKIPGEPKGTENSFEEAMKIRMRILEPFLGELDKVIHLLRSGDTILGADQVMSADAPIEKPQG